MGEEGRGGKGEGRTESGSVRVVDGTVLEGIGGVAHEREGDGLVDEVREGGVDQLEEEGRSVGEVDVGAVLFGARIQSSESGSRERERRGGATHDREAQEGRRPDEVARVR